MKKELTKNISSKSAIKDIISLGDRLCEHLQKLNKFLQQNKFSEAELHMNTIYDLSKEINKMSKRLPEKFEGKKEDIVLNLVSGQQKLEKIAKESSFLLSVQYEIAKNTNEYMRSSIKKKVEEELGYDSDGNINLTPETIMPITFANEI